MLAWLGCAQLPPQPGVLDCEAQAWPCDPVLARPPFPVLGLTQTPTLTFELVPGPLAVSGKPPDIYATHFQKAWFEFHYKLLAKKKYIFIIKIQMGFWHMNWSLDTYQVT